MLVTLKIDTLIRRGSETSRRLVSVIDNYQSSEYLMTDEQPSPDSSSPVAWRRIAACLRTQIQTGKLSPGNPAPSITTLVQDYTHARATCAKALRALAAEGLLIRYPGLGYYIADSGDQAVSVHMPASRASLM
jgi:DNA-binding transcriptional regulator YhcF (GntR family)